MVKEEKKIRISEYRFLELFVATVLLEKNGFLIDKNKLQDDLFIYYDDNEFKFLFEDICKRNNLDSKYVDLNKAFIDADAFGLLTMICDNSKDSKYVINISYKEALTIISNYNGKEMYAMIKLVQKIYKRNDVEELMELEKQYVLYMKNMIKTNPEEAKRIAIESLERIGIIDKNCELKPPYNGEVVNSSDFTRGSVRVKRREIN